MLKWSQNSTTKHVLKEVIFLESNRKSLKLLAKNNMCTSYFNFKISYITIEIKK